MEKPCQYTFENQNTATTIQIQDVVELPQALQQIGLSQSHPTLVLVGGAGGISEVDMLRLRDLFTQELAPILQNLGAAVVDGGTDAGIMSLMGQARAAIGGTFPLVGVCAIGTVSLPGEEFPDENTAPLEPGHSHFILVPGNQWGDECPWIADVASVLSNRYPSVTLVVNGGEITYRDLWESVKTHRPIITLAGSGRTADQVAAALKDQATEPQAKEIVDSGDIQAVPLEQAEGQHPFSVSDTPLTTTLINKLSSPPPKKTPSTNNKEQNMAKKKSYRQQLREEMSAIIDTLEMSELQKNFMKSRWLDQLLWLEGRAESSRNQYYRLRLMTIIGGVLVPALVSFNPSDDHQILGIKTRDFFTGATWIVSQMVAISAAVEEFFQYGNRYRQYRNTAEEMKIEGWKFLQKSPPYDDPEGHETTYVAFASRVEDIMEKDIEGFVNKLVQEKQTKQTSSSQQSGNLEYTQSQPYSSSSETYSP